MPRKPKAQNPDRVPPNPHVEEITEPDISSMGFAEGRHATEAFLKNPVNPINAVALDESRRERQGLPSRHPFDQEQASRFCYLVAASTMSMRQIGLELGIPPSTFLLWCQRYEGLAEQYARAREARMYLLADEIIEIADDGFNDWMMVETKAGRLVEQFDHEHAKRSEIRIKTRQWVMARFAPKTFGERLQLDAGKETREAIAAKSDAERLEEMLALIARAKRRVAEAIQSGEISEADFEDVSGDSEKE